MNFTSYAAASESVKEQLKHVCDIWQTLLGNDLIGVYLHGSMALGRFCEGMSDLDLLVVSKRRITPEERRSAVRALIETDKKPCPIELSAICEKELNPWRHPTVCCFHYSDYHTENYIKLLNGEIDGYYIADNDFEDSDIACHVRLTKQCGICLCGKSIAEVFPEVPEQDFISSICDDYETYDFHSYNERYFYSNILLLGRILSYFKSGHIISKYDAGVWAAEYVPARFAPIISNSLSVWYENGEPIKYDEDELEALRKLLIDEIKAELDNCC